MAKARILIIDGSVVDRRVMSRCLGADPALEVIGYAAIASAAITKVKQLQPDLVVLDVDMPDIQGLELLKSLLEVVPELKIIVVSAHTDRGAEITFEALSRGAKDYSSKPYDMTDDEHVAKQFNGDLIPKIKALLGLSHDGFPDALSAKVDAARGMSLRPGGFPQRVDVLAIGASTGGPDALKVIVNELPANFPVPILIVQHMPSLFTKRLAMSLSSPTGLVAREAMHGVIPVPGEVWVAPGDHHMVVEKMDGAIRLGIHQGPHENFCRPSADVLFRSVADVFGAHTLAVVLTGMGKDGVAGCHQLKQKGAQILAQDKASSVVWGMPGLVSEAGLADKVLPLRLMVDEIVQRVKHHRSWTPGGLSYQGAPS
jgi:two-component system, chemotaxis family, protein-glutamate methylesterase/glutaminase